MTDYKKVKLALKLHKFYWITGTGVCTLAGMCGVVLLGKWLTMLVIYLIS
jgi:hypothetical protein